ncbi:hypothetical protein AB0910_15840 [Streptomyces sp. NPDC047002]|uniref:hypothetical protein n=1 Tax=Streptomyces sp. NPDC047002 TaxID=3155475 RepID=UPI003453AA73
MRQALVPVVAWSLATGAAVTLSWWGVHSVMAGTAYDPPRAVPLTAAGPTAVSTPPPLVPATRRPEPSSPPPAPTPSATRSAPSPSPPAPTGAPASSPAPAHAARLRSYEITGGRAVFSVTDTSASLVSATPEAGWQVQTWSQPEWVRVTFTRGTQESSVFYTWNGHAPTVQFDAR